MRNRFAFTAAVLTIAVATRCLGAPPVITDSLGRIRELQNQINVLYAKIVTGNLNVGNGGTGANLSATGGTSFVLRQSSVGANVTVSQLAASDLSNGVTGSGAVVLATSPTITSPTLTTPNIGVATATTVNKVTITPPATSATLAIADGKTLTALNSITLAGTDGKTLTTSNSITLAGTDATVMTFPSTSATIARIDAAQTFAGNQTFGGTIRMADGSAGSPTIARSAAGAEGFYFTSTGFGYSKTASVAAKFAVATSAERTVTLPDADTKLAVYGQTITYAGPTIPRTVTLPDLDFTVARTSGAQNFTGPQTFLDAMTIWTPAGTAAPYQLILGKDGTGGTNTDPIGIRLGPGNGVGSSSRIQFNRAGVGAATVGVSGDTSSFLTGDAAGDLDIGSTQKINFSAALPARQMVLLTSGNVGIGNVSPATRLHVGLGGTGTQAEEVRVDSGSGSGGDSSFSMYRNGVIKGKVGVSGVAGTIITGSAIDDLNIKNSQAINLSADGGTTKHVILDASGNVGIGATPRTGQRLFVMGEGFFDFGTGGVTNGGALRVVSNGNAAFLASNQYFSGSVKYARTGGSSAIYFDTQTGATAGDIVFQTAPSGTVDTAITQTTQMTLKRAGDLSLSTSAMTAGTMTMVNSANVKGVVHRFDWTNAMVTALGAVTAGDVAVCTLPARTRVVNAYVVITSAAGTVTTLTVAVGRTSAAYIDYIVASDAKAAANTVYGDASAERGTNLTSYDLPSFTATTVVNAHFISTGGNLSTVSSSTGTVYLTTETLP